MNGEIPGFSVLPSSSLGADTFSHKEEIELYLAHGGPER